MNGNFIITGCSQGFGREFALRIVRSGGRVVIADANVHKGEVIAKEMENCLFVECDVTDPDDWDELWDEATKFFDERGVQVLVNNVGATYSPGWRKSFQNNLTGLGLGTDMAMRKMSKEHGGSGGTVVHIGSIAGLQTPPEGLLETTGPAYYIASKFAIVGLSNSLAGLYDRTGVKHMVLCPELSDFALGSTTKGWNMEKLKELKSCRPEDIGDAFERMIKEGENGATIMALSCGIAPVSCPYPMSTARRVIQVLKKSSSFLWHMEARTITLEKNFVLIGLGIVALMLAVMYGFHRVLSAYKL